MSSTVATILNLAGIILMVGFGSFIARHIGVEQWQFAGFVFGLILCVGAPVWELQRRLKAIEAKVGTDNQSRG